MQDKQTITAALAPAPAPVPVPEPVLEEIDFDDSTVLKYLCGQDGKGRSEPEGAGSAKEFLGSEAAAEGSKVVGLRVVEPDRPLSASGLSNIYSMHFGGGGGGGPGGGGGRGEGRVAPPLLAAGGKGGIVALFSTKRSQVRSVIFRV